MIEMLGVLAIIGVLSAGGIWGYNQAMESYNFNKFVKDIQTMAGASISILPKLHNHTGTITWQGQVLNKLGILPDDLYKTATSPTSNYVKNPFTGKMDWLIMLHETNDPAGLSITSNLGSYTYPTDRHVTYFNMWFAVSQRVCVKIVTHNWSETSPSWYFITNRTTYPNWLASLADVIAGPVNMNTAKAWCKEGENMMQMLLYVHGRTPVWQ